MGNARLMVATLAGLLIWPLTMGWSADLAKGKELHDKACNDCHAGKFGGDAAKIYTRPDRKMTSLDKLSVQVAYCNQQVGTQWFDEEVASVVEYLNATHYHFQAVAK